jgi:transposase InsO family protein
MEIKINKDKIEEIINKIKENKLSYKDGAKLLGIKVKALYDYNYRKNKRNKKNKQKESGTNRVKDTTELVKKDTDKEKKKEELSILGVSGIPEELQKIIVEYRKEHQDHGYKRIQDTLKSDHFVVIARKKIREVLKAHGLEKTCDSSFDQRDKTSKKGARRFEAGYPRDLYQMDVTYVYITGIKVLYLAIIIDDYSRFCVASELRRDQRGTTMIDVLHRAIERYGKPRRLLTDQGSSFYTWSHESTLFQKYLDDMEIEHIVADPHSPETCGKVERLNQTIQRELIQKVRFSSYADAQRGIEEYFHSYNYDRPHQGIDGACPCDRYHGIIGERARIESKLTSKDLDFSKGYIIFKDQDHTISIVGSSKGLQIFMDGKLLKGEKNDDNSGGDQAVEYSRSVD